MQTYLHGIHTHTTDSKPLGLAFGCRFLATHGYNISLTHLVDQIASPYPKKLYAARTTAVLDEWPTPTDYYYNIREGTLSKGKCFFHYGTWVD